MIKVCANCDLPLNDAFVFCPHCGQKMDVGRLSIKDVGHEALQQLTNVDKGLFTLLKDLITHPGVGAREYVQGKRKRHFPPFNFFLLVGTIMIVVLSFSRPESVEERKAYPRLTNVQNPAERARLQGIYERRDRSGKFMTRYSDIVAMIAVPLMALIYRAAYWKFGYNFTEHLVGGMYMISFMNLVWVLLFVPLSSMISTGNGVGWAIEGVHKLVELVYFSIFYKNFTSSDVRPSALRAFVVSFIVVFTWTLLTTLAITLYITTGFFGLID